MLVCLGVAVQLQSLSYGVVLLLQADAPILDEHPWTSVFIGLRSFVIGSGPKVPEATIPERTSSERLSWEVINRNILNENFKATHPKRKIPS